MTAPDPIALSIFGMEIRWYGILIGLGFLIGIGLSYYRAPSMGIKQDHVLDFSIFMIPLSIIGARAYYVLFEWENYKGDIGKILDIRGGGLAIHGGLIVGILVCYFVSKYHKAPTLGFLDLLFPQVALGQAIGRWGNFFNSEAHGGPTDLPWGIMVDGVKVHPTFLYESIWCLLLFFFLLYMSKRRKFIGQIALLYGMLYSVERFFVEALRTDSLMIGQFKQAQVLSAVVIVLCLLVYIFLSNKSKKENDI